MMSEKLSATEVVKRTFNWSNDELLKFAHTAPFRYKTFTIPKRGGGDREISQPSRDLKAVQRLILEKVLSKKLIVHDCATAYKLNTSICDNARPHLKNQFLLKMDFKDFFPSITALDFLGYLKKNDFLVDEDEAKFLCYVFFKYTNMRVHLCIGSPGSPIISNAMLYEFDEAVLKEIVSCGIAYTRYSDDLTFSTNEKDVLFAIPDVVEKILKANAAPALCLNTAKTVFSSKKFNRHVTGITISNDGEMSIGHEKKRKIRSLVFKADSLSPPALESLRGYLSFINQVEPRFLEKLKVKYPIQMKQINATVFQQKWYSPVSIP